MFKKNDYTELQDTIIQLIGGEDNLVSFTHCVTRLRFNVKDKSLIDEYKIKKIKNVISTAWGGDQFQIIIGQMVGDVYNLICEKHNLEKKDTIVDFENSKKNKNYSISSVLENIAKCFIPLIPAFVGSGMIKILLLILTMSNLLTMESSTYVILDFASNAVFYFFPVFVGYTASKNFGGNPAIGMLLGAILISPTFIENVNNQTSMSIFGIPVHAATYTQTVFPIILSTFVMSYVERFIAKISPMLLRSILVPLATLLIMIPLMLCLLAPIGSFIGVYIAAGIMWIYDTIGFLAVGLLASLLPFLILTGMHYGFMPYWLASIGTLGYEPIYILSNVIYNINQGVACLAVSIKTKNVDLKGISASSGVSAIVAGVSEPALFGVTLKLKKPLWCSMIGCFIGGMIAGLCKVYVFAIPGTWGILSLPIFIDTGNNLICLIIALVVSCITTFCLTIFSYKDLKEEN